MTTLWNPDFLKRYQKSFCEAAVAKAFAGSEALGGKDLLRLSPCKQLNFFVMKSLFNQWQEEMKRLESPYFDYKVPEVKKAMVQFMNVLSQNIRVEERDLQGLVEEALEQCILIVVEPAEFIRREFEAKGDATYAPKQSAQLLKYIKVLDTEFHELLLEKAQGSYSDVIRDAAEYFSSVELSAARETVFGQLNQVAAISLEDVLSDVTETPEPIQEEGSSEMEEADAFTAPTASLEEEVEEEEAVEDLPATINDQFEKPADKPLVEHLQQADGVTSIMESISLNQRYMFAQELFSGDANVFQNAIGEIEHERSFDEAVEHLVTNYASDNSWDMNSDVVKELLKAVFRKFR